MNNLASIIYISTAHIGLTSEDIDSILENSRVRNSKINITGMLLYCNGTFMQYLEGPTESLDALYSKIELDERHHGVMQYFYRPIESRICSDWSMAYSVAPQTFIDEVTQAFLSNESNQNEIVSLLLSDFWKGNVK